MISHSFKLLLVLQFLQCFLWFQDSFSNSTTHCISPFNAVWHLVKRDEKYLRCCTNYSSTANSLFRWIHLDNVWVHKVIVSVRPPDRTSCWHYRLQHSVLKLLGTQSSCPSVHGCNLKSSEMKWQPLPNCTGENSFNIMDDTAFKTCTHHPWRSIEVFWIQTSLWREKKIPSNNFSCFFSCTCIGFPLVTPCTQQSVNCFTCWTLCVLECRPLGTHAIWLFTSFSLCSFPPAGVIWTHSSYFLKYNSNLVMCGSVWWLIFEHCVDAVGGGSTHV